MKELLLQPEWQKYWPYLFGVLVLAIGWPITTILSRFFMAPFNERLDPHSKVLIKKVLIYSLRLLVVFTALGEMGLNLKVLLGAAGIFSVAIGFASQTSASNLISGFFMLVERPFSVNDYIEVGEIEGTVMSIDLLSTRIRTLDNLFIRVPNEILMKAPIKNLTHFPIRRIDLKLGVDYNSDLAQVEKVLIEMAIRCIGILDNPPPLFIVKDLADSAIELQLSVWSAREDYIESKNQLIRGVLRVFKENSISIPFPHRVIVTKEIT